MKETLIILCAILFATFNSSVFAQQMDFSKSILTIGIYDMGACGLVNSIDRGSAVDPDDKISLEVKEHIEAEKIGTGFIYSYNGKKYVITCEHVTFKSGNVVGYDSAFKGYKLKLVGGDTFYDVAVLEFVNPNEAKQFNSIQFEKQLPDVDEQVQSMGYWNLENTLMSFSGKVLDKEHTLKDTRLTVPKLGFIKNTAKLPRGFSGGILIDKDNKVLGMNILRLKSKHYFYALQSSIVKRIVENIIDNGKAQRAFTGIQFAQNTQDCTVTINSIISSSPAAEKCRDQLENKVIKKINGNDISDIYSVLQIMEKIRPGTPITIELDDDECTFTSVTLERERLRQIAEHAIQYHKDISIKGEAVIVNTTKEEEATMAGVKGSLVYCLDSVEQLGMIIRIFGLHRELKIGTGDSITKSGRTIYFSDDDDMKVLYY